MKIFGFDIKKRVPDSGGFVKGWVDTSSSWYKPNWFQLGQDKPNAQEAIRSSAVFACVSVLAQEIARLRVTHYTDPGLEGREEMYNSHTTRLLANPNPLQTRSDFFLMVMYSLLMEGNGYCLATRDVRGRVTDLRPLNPRAVQPYIVPGSTEVFYQITSQVNQMDFNPEDFVPQRNMLHIRLFTPNDPLIGISPLTACMTSVAQGMSIQSESTRFFDNEAKPSGILRTPKPLTPTQAQRLRDAWASGTSGANTGKVPVLDNDLQFQQMALSATDAQLIEQYSMTKKDIAIVYRVPLYMVGEGENQFKTAEAAQRDFVTRSLGFYIEHIEASLDSFFGFNGRTESIEFDVERGIMRPEYNERIEGLAKGVQGGIFTPNEARKTERLPPVEGGDEAYMQRQNVPLNLLGVDVMTDVAASSPEENTSEETSPEETQENSYSNLRKELGLVA